MLLPARFAYFLIYFVLLRMIPFDHVLHLERIETPSQFSLHRRVRVRTPSIENEALRKEINEAVDERSENEKPKATAGSPRRKFYRHKSFCVVRPDQAGIRHYQSFNVCSHS